MVTIEKLSREIVKQILVDIGIMETKGDVKFTLTKTEKYALANAWVKITENLLTESIIKDQSYTAAFDGGAKPNPGDMKIGGWIRNPKGTRIYSYTEKIGHGTNNEAEYNSLIKLMEEIKRRGIKKVHIQGDSALAVNQVNGTWKTKDPRMKCLRDNVRKVALDIEYHLEHVLRKFNSEADSLT